MVWEIQYSLIAHVDCCMFFLSFRRGHVSSGIFFEKSFLFKFWDCPRCAVSTVV